MLKRTTFRVIFCIVGSLFLLSCAPTVKTRAARSSLLPVDIPPPTMTREQLTIARYEDRKMIDANTKEIASLRALVKFLAESDFEEIDGVVRIKRGVVLYDPSLVGYVKILTDTNTVVPPLVPDSLAFSRKSKL